MTGSSCTSLVLGITGGLACGKSEVGRVLQKIGFAVCDADHVAHELMKRGSPIHRAVVEHFGTKILSSDGEVARSILGKIIFKNPEERENLNGIVHPAVRDYLKTWISEVHEQKRNAAVLVPLLFESGMDTLNWDAIICVSSSNAQVLERLEKRGLNQREAALRVASQLPLEQKKEQSDYVVLNIGTLDELEQSTRETVDRIMAER